MLRFHLVSLFPEFFRTPLETALLGRAREAGIVDFSFHDPRSFSTSRHHHVDDRPYGGGPGMVMQGEPVAAALRSIEKPGRMILLAPSGRPLNDALARELAREEDLTLICGRYEGLDARLLDIFPLEPVSVGEAVLNGGETAALAVIESVARLVPGFMGKEESGDDESFSNGLLEYPQYTRPEVWEGRAVPPVLLEGNHQKIDAWRGQQSRERTRLRRPELYEQWCETHPLTEIPKWKRGENVRLVKTAEQMEAAAKLFAEGRRSICAGGWVQEALDALTPEMFLPQLQQEKQEGWVCYLHYTRDVPDATVSVHHKTGQVEHLFVTESARGRGIGQKMLDFARKKLPEHEHPVLTVLNTNTRALALYRRMGWQVVGTKEKFDPAKDPLVVRPSQVLEMRYQG